MTLRDKFYGCICGAQIGLSVCGVQIGTPVLSGNERQKLMITAIIEKGNRINAEDVRYTWVRDIQEDAILSVSEPYEYELLKIAKTRVPAREIGRFCDYSGLGSFARSCHPIGLINAGHIQNAIEDTLEIGQLYQTANSRGLKWATVTAVCIAAATKPGATIDSMLQAIYTHLDERQKVESRDDGWYAAYAGVNVVDEIKNALEYTKNCRDAKDLRKAFDAHYDVIGMPYTNSYANEVVTKGVCIAKMVNGNVKDAITIASDIGRDTDSVAAIAGGIAGALTGSTTIPPEWIQKADDATKALPYTNNRRTLRQHADGIYDAFKNKLQLLTANADLMDY